MTVKERYMKLPGRRTSPVDRAEMAMIVAVLAVLTAVALPAFGRYF